MTAMAHMVRRAASGMLGASAVPLTSSSAVARKSQLLTRPTGLRRYVVYRTFRVLRNATSSQGRPTRGMPRTASRALLATPHL